MVYGRIFARLNDSDSETRLDALKTMVEKGWLELKNNAMDVNNHIHTWYSFSPYSPTKALALAIQSGLSTAGIMDHDSVAGVREFITGGKITGLPVTSGIELRVDMSNTVLNGKRINNPDQNGIAYMALHGIPHNRLDDLEMFCKPIRCHRENRNRLMLEGINVLIKAYMDPLDYDRDVIPLSMRHEGGSVTERHLLFALSQRIIATLGEGFEIVNFLAGVLGISVSERNKGYLLNAENPYYAYDLLNALKSDLTEKFYIPASKECPHVSDVITLANQIGAISAYAYLGDVGDSVTGDKKSQKFEDDYIDELFGELKNLGFHAVTYMPSRNTAIQLQKVKALCEMYDFMEISGEDINSPRQNFICEALRDPKYHHLATSTRALIEHEISATCDKQLSLFSQKSVVDNPNLKQRIDDYAKRFLNRF